MATATAPPPGAVTDEALMQRIQAYSIDAFEELYDRYSAKGLGLARTICGPDHAEDGLQEGFLAVWRSAARFDPRRGGARAWLLAVIRHRCIDMMRRVGRDAALVDGDGELDHLPAPGSVAQDAESRDEAYWIRSSLQGLPALQREVIALAYFGGLSHTEIAARLQLPAGTVKGRMRLGLQKVRAEIIPQPSPNSRRAPTADAQAR